jgi:hypothetical protein
MVSTDAKNMLELLSPEPCIDLSNCLIVLFENLLEVTTMDKNVSAQYTEVLMTTMCVAYDDELHSCNYI